MTSTLDLYVHYVALYTATFGCDRGNVEKAQVILARDPFAQIGATPIDATELRQAKALLLQEIPLSESASTISPGN